MKTTEHSQTTHSSQEATVPPTASAPASSNTFSAKSSEQNPRPRKLQPAPLILGALLLAGGIFAAKTYLHAQHYEETDDSQIEENISPIIPRVAGYIADIRFRENQPVKAGDTLVLLDEKDLSIKVLQAEAALQNAEANVAAVQANVRSASANSQTASSAIETAKSTLAAAKVRVWKAEQDFERFKKLIADKATTQQQFDAAKAELETAQAQLETAKNQLSTAQKQEAASKVQIQSTETQVSVALANVAQKKADVEYAKLQRSYTVLTAPASGITSKKSIQIGQYVQAGQSLFSVVGEKDTWVVANFKETQLQKMKIGQAVDIKVDAFPDVVLHGTIESMSGATGAKFALLPPDNASGNFVKVVQRVPVKIVFSENNPIIASLRAGMNVHTTVHVD